jgi:hypothetical protein
MKHLLDILAIPSAIILIVYVLFYFKHKKEIKKETAKKMKKRGIQPKKRYTGLPWMPYV